MRILRDEKLTVEFCGVDADLLNRLFGSVRERRNTLVEPLAENLCVDRHAQWMHSQLLRCDYKPGWVWTVKPPLNVYPVLQTTFPARNSYSPDSIITVTALNEPSAHLMEAFSEDLFVAWLAFTMFGIERHESQEWLRRDGAIWSDPHDPKNIF